MCFRKRKIEFKKMGKFPLPNYRYIYSLEEFLEEVGCTFIEGDGLIEVLVDEEVTNIIVPEWMWWWFEGHPSLPDPCVVKKLKDLKRIEGEVQIVYKGK